MKNYFQAERMKYRHTFIEKLLVLMPMISTLFAAALTYEYFTIDNYNWWYTTLYPALIAIVCGGISSKDKKMQNRAIFHIPCDVGKVWDAKVLTGSAASGISVLVMGGLTIIAAGVMKTGLKLEFAMELSLGAQILGCFLIWLTSLWQIPFCLWLSEKTGMLPMLIVHMACSLFSGFFIALKPWYMAVPGAIMPRINCTILQVLPNGLPAVSGSVTYTPELVSMQNVVVGIPMAVLWFLFFWLASRKWFEGQVC